MMAMDGVELAKRKAVETVVAALCVECGYHSAEHEAVGILTEIIQSCKKPGMVSIVIMRVNISHMTV